MPVSIFCAIMSSFLKILPQNQSTIAPNLALMLSQGLFSDAAVSLLMYILLYFGMLLSSLLINLKNTNVICLDDLSSFL